MKLSAILEPLIAAGVPGDVILATVRAYEEQAAAAADQGKEKARARWRRWKSKQDANVSKRLQTDANVSKRLARVEDNLLGKDISGEKNKTNTNAREARGSDLAAFKAELSDLDSERLEAIIKHRRLKRGQLTGHAARLFRTDATACGLSLTEAVDACISRNWITVKPEYFALRNTVPRQSTSPPRKPNAVDAYHAIAREKGWISDEPEFLPSTDQDAQRLSAVGGGPSGTVVDLRPGAFRRVRSGDM